VRNGDPEDFHTMLIFVTGRHATKATDGSSESSKSRLSLNTQGKAISKPQVNVSSPQSAKPENDTDRHPMANPSTLLQELSNKRLFNAAWVQSGMTFMRWAGEYINGTVLVSGERGSSTLRSVPCDICRNLGLVCLEIQPHDKYRLSLPDPDDICCGWCMIQCTIHGIIREARGEDEEEEEEEEERRLQRQTEAVEIERKDGRRNAQDHGRRQYRYRVIAEGINRDVIRDAISQLNYDTNMRPLFMSKVFTHTKVIWG